MEDATDKPITKISLIFLCVLCVLVIVIFSFVSCGTKETSADCIKNAQQNATASDQFPDGTKIDPWFSEVSKPDRNSLGKYIDITQIGTVQSEENTQPSSAIIKANTKAIQTAIDSASSSGGGLIYVSKGVTYTGALFFKQGVNLYIESGAMLKGSDDITDYPVCETRIEGEWCKYYPALINADNCKNFTISGNGTLDGNGQRSWAAFWQRRDWNPDCTNKDEQRARLLFISNSSNVTISDIHIQNSQFWSSHIYKCDHVKYLGVSIYSPVKLKPPSTDAIDIDACCDVLIKNCFMEVNDDAIALKGGKGPWADSDEYNGPNERIIVEDCNYGYCHSCLTCGSESIHNKNIILRNIKVDNADRLFWVKLRPDTPQNYEYITIEGITGKITNFIYVYPWTQFFDLKGRTDMPKSSAHNITMRNCNVVCEDYYNVEFNDDQYILKDFYFENNKVDYEKFGNEAFKSGE